ncbi:alkaline phosphatase synthesis sensor protein PhoR [Andreesenia angusta]|uniref:histidine kinase n=1 Tax=Andreesenia angusta TaxID=39480 RepID=A0A1S1V4S5_9FIRM|nr:alkaline phosphatase synthesis sensor protein PhoR [Andreesenia angusta]
MVIDGERKTRVQGIKKRWVYNYVIIILAVLMVLEIGFMIFIKNYYYGDISRRVSDRAVDTTQFYHIYLDSSDYTLEEIADRMVRDFPRRDDESLEFQIVDTSGDVIVSSSGFYVDRTIDTSDYTEALKGNLGTWQGRDPETEERIMAASSPIERASGEVIGAIRYITSLEEANKTIIKIFMVSMLFVLLTVAMMMMMSVLFSKSIINPLNEINEVAKKMAEGQFSERIEKHYNDEIGELADTINYMAGEIVNSANLKNEFISSISHELRTPLTSIKGWSETIVTGDFEDKEEARLGLNIIIKETTRLSQMVEELLDFSKMESGRIVLHLEDVDIRSELEDIVSIARLRAKKDGIDLLYHRTEELPLVVGDKNRLKQVFINIIDNAIKFTPEGKDVYVEADSDEEYVYVKIRDEGIGIPKEDLDHIYEKFFKGKSKKSGSGIGLAISKEIMNLHKGELRVDSEVDEGTTVTLVIPLKEEA